jgi:hypothetical protein
LELKCLNKINQTLQNAPPERSPTDNLLSVGRKDTVTERTPFKPIPDHRQSYHRGDLTGFDGASTNKRFGSLAPASNDLVSG